MKPKLTRKLAAALLLLSTLIHQPSTSLAQGTAFTYSGRLENSGAPANGTYDLEFAIFDSSSGPAPVGGTLTNSATAVSNGLFTVTLDFGAGVFTGAPRWLEMGVRTNGAGTFTTLNPRQSITATPYAITAGNLTGPVAASQLSGALPSAQLSGTFSNAVTLNNAANQLSGAFTGNGSGVTNVNAATLGGLNSANFWRTDGNAGTTAGTHFLGTTDNQALELKVNGLRALRLVDNGDSTSDSDSIPDGAPNVIGGAPMNFVAAGVVGATISGGGATNYDDFARINLVTKDYGTVGGGLGNTSSGFAAAVGGGYYNTSGFLATVGGGEENTSSGFAATVGGGQGNTSASAYSTVGGGIANTNSGEWATIPGGRENRAVGRASFAAGYRAKANHQGSFVWADSTVADFASTANDQFSIRAAGGVRIQGSAQITGGNANQLILQNSDDGNRYWHIYDDSFNGSGALVFTPSTGTGAYIDRANGSYHVNSDARLKQDIAPLDGVLDRVLQLRPVSYHFRSQPDSSRLTLGFIAQEVEPLFPEVVSEHDGMKGLAYSELVPVAVGAIQELNQKLAHELKRRDTENAELRGELDKLKHAVEKLAHEKE